MAGHGAHLFYVILRKCFILGFDFKSIDPFEVKEENVERIRGRAFFRVRQQVYRNDVITCNVIGACV